MHFSYYEVDSFSFSSLLWLLVLIFWACFFVKELLLLEDGFLLFLMIFFEGFSFFFFYFYIRVLFSGEDFFIFLGLNKFLYEFFM